MASHDFQAAEDGGFSCEQMAAPPQGGSGTFNSLVGRGENIWTFRLILYEDVRHLGHLE